MTLKKQVVKGFKWTSYSTIFVAGTALLKISILTRYLDKSDFGMMALITFVLGFMELFNDMGLSSAILHRQDITKKVYASLYWLNLLISVAIYIILLGVTPLVSLFYNQPLLNLYIPILGINILISGIGRQFKVIKQKELAFKQISIIDMISATLSLIIAVLLAINGYGVLSLVYSALFQYLFSNFCFFINGLRSQGLLLYYKFEDTKPFLRMGIYQVGGQIVNYFNGSIDILLIGRLFNSEILGGYSLAKQLVMRPVQFINPVVMKVASPTLARFQFDIDLLKKNYLKLISFLSSVNFLIYIVIIVFAPIIVKILYGDNFNQIVSIVRVLCIYMIFRALWNPISSLVIATGRTDLEFKWSLVAITIFPISIFIGAQFGIIGVTIAITASMILLFIPSWKFLINKMIGASLKEYVKAILSFNIKNFKI